MITPSPLPGVKTADLVMDGCEWEVKCPSKDARSTIEHAFRAALKQSKNVIIDLRRLTNDSSRAEKRLLHEFDNSQSVCQLKIISKSGVLFELMK